MSPERFWALPWATVLSPLGWLYGAGWRVYAGLYAAGIKRAVAPHPRAIRVGGLMAGGVGKSPVTIHLAELLSEMGRSVTMGASGYGSPRAEAATLAPTGPLDPAEWGDEPAMLRERLPNAPLVVGRRRVLAARLAHENDPEGVLLMDDGFQHLPLATALSLVIDPVRPESARCLPVGPYREQRLFGRRRADAVLETGGGEGWRVEYSPLVWSDGPPTGGLLCALGHPARFVEAAGPPTGPVVLKNDHDPLTQDDLLAPFDPGATIGVTEKDWVKLRRRPDVGDYRFTVARRDARIEPAHEFRAWLHNRLDAMDRAAGRMGA